MKKMRKTAHTNSDNTALVNESEAEVLGTSQTGIERKSAEEKILQEMNIESLQVRWELERYSVIRELYRAHTRLVCFFMKPDGGGLSMQEAVQRACGEMTDDSLQENLERAVGANVDEISWYTLDKIFLQDPSFAEQIWEDIKEQADKDFRSGHFAAELFERAEWLKSPWRRARFIAVRDGFMEEYQPRGAIEVSMIDVLAVNFFLWMYWVEVHLQRSNTRPKAESTDYKRWKQKREAEDKDSSYMDQFVRGEWDMPFQSEAAAVEQAAQMADRFRRAYQSQLRAIRDWRRYSVPVTIHNPQQVNIAAEGGQQINVSQEKTNPKRKK